MDGNSKIGKRFRINKSQIEDKRNKSNYLNQYDYNIPNAANLLDQAQKEISKYIELFFQIYLFYEKLKKQINQSLINSKIEHYYIIKKEWMTKFLAYFEYNKFVEYMNKGNIDDIINKYKNNNSQYIVELMKLLPNDYTKKIQSKIADKNEFNKIKKFEYNLKLKEKTPIPNKTIYYYYTDIEILNEEIFNYIKDIINIQNRKKRDFLIGDNKIIMEFNLSNQCSIIIDSYIDFNFTPSILLDFNENKYIDYYFQCFIKSGHKETMKHINVNDYPIFKIYYNSFKEIGYAFNLDKLENNEDNIKVPNPSPPIKNNILSNINSQNKNYSKIGTIKSDTNKFISSSKKDIITMDLNYFMQNQIKALILYHYFTEDIPNKVFLSNEKGSNAIYNHGKCYLIDESWMNLYKTIFAYQELKKQIKNIPDKNSFETAKKNIDKIIMKLDKKYVNKLKSIEVDSLDEMLVSVVVETDNFLEVDKGKIIIKKHGKYDIINPEIFEYMNKASQKGIKILKDLKQNEYIINDGKFIVKYESQKRYELLIGNYNLEIDKLEPEILFKYESNESMVYHFENLKKFSYKIFKVKHTSQDRMKLTLSNNDESKNSL